MRVTGKGRVVAYQPGKEIVIRTETAKGEAKRLKLAIPHSAEWPHLGSVFFEAIFEPPANCKGNFPVHSPMRPETVAEGMEVWYALEGVKAESLQLYQIACHLESNNAARFNAVVRNAVKVRESRNQPEIARDYQCRLIEAPKGSGNYPDDPDLLSSSLPTSTRMASGPPSAARNRSNRSLPQELSVGSGGHLLVSLRARSSTNSTAGG